ncbi:WD repeat-containing protein 54, variant 2 [Trebouxia sp. C0010 RCD-2024]
MQIQQNCVVVLATSVGIQVWDLATQQQLYCWDVHPKCQGISPASLCRGLALLQVEDAGCLLCVGGDTGTIHTFDTSDMSRIQHNYDITHHSAPIAALTAEQAASSGTLASSDDNGTLTVFHAKSFCAFQVVHSWEGHGVPCVSIAIKSSTLIGAFYDGSVRMHSLVDGLVRTELQAHSRLLAAMAVHPTRNMFATASEDATLAVWMLSEDQSQARPLLSACWNNAVLTGIAFTGPASNSIAAAAYDTDEIAVWAFG